MLILKMLIDYQFLPLEIAQLDKKKPQEKY
ncbi:Uncharacterised protein [Yersinia enterocolitica]|nr:Uncharacterised protein [Yersinia enterocolitica]CRX54047.1 Uncharacterised protein [Yersinia enterocolitica]